MDKTSESSLVPATPLVGPPRRARGGRLAPLLPWFERAGSLFMPPICLHCESRRWMGAPLCLGCLRKLRPLRSPACDVCGMAGCGAAAPGRAAGASEVHGDWCFPFRSTRFLFLMGPELSTLVHGFKYRHFRRHIPFLCAYLRFRPDLLDFVRGCDALVPVPLHAARLRERGYNQAEAIATEFARASGATLMADALRRVRATGTQTKLGRGQRQGNLRRAFVCPEPALLAGKRVILVDDVFTTGATAEECARLMLRAGCARVDVLTLAKVEAQPAPGSGSAAGGRVEDDFLREMEAAAGFYV
jgi:ComF family protein